MLTHADAPIEGLPEEMKDRVLHTRLDFHGQMLMGGDAPPGMHQPGTDISVSIQVDSIEDAERIFEALAERGSIQMPIDQQPWAARFGMFADRFGIPWMVNGESCP